MKEAFFLSKQEDGMMGRTVKMLVMGVAMLGLAGCCCTREVEDVRYEMQRLREDVAEGLKANNAELEQMRKTHKDVVDNLNRDHSSTRRSGTRPGPE
jgi:hypothetical protein